MLGYFFNGPIVFLNKEFSRSVLVDYPSYLMQADCLMRVLLILLEVKVISLDVDACYSASSVLHVDGEQDPLSEPARLQTQIDAGGDHLSYFPPDYAELLPVLLILHLIKHQHWDSPLKQLHLCQFNLLRPKIYHQKVGKFSQWFFKYFVEPYCIVFIRIELYSPNLHEYDAVHIFAFVLPIYS